MEKICCAANSGDGDVAQLVEHRTGTLPALVRFPGAARDFFLRVNFPCRLSYGILTPLCAVVCLNIRVRDPVVRVRVWWIMEILKHPACTVSWVMRLLQLAFLEESNLNLCGKNPNGTIQLLDLKKKIVLCHEPTFFCFSLVKSIPTFYTLRSSVTASTTTTTTKYFCCTNIDGTTSQSLQIFAEFLHFRSACIFTWDPFEAFKESLKQSEA